MKTPPFHQRSKANSDGFSLVEIVIALSVVAFAFLSIVGLMGVGLVSDQNSTQQTEATNIAASIISDLQNTQNVPGTTTLTPPRYGPTTGLTLSNKTPPATQAAAPLSGNNTSSTILYFDDKGELTTKTSTTDPAIFYAKVISAQVVRLASATNTNGNPVFVARVIVAWPAQALAGAKGVTQPPAGSVELVTQFQLHTF